MSEGRTTNGVYWRIWTILLAITAGMIFLDQAPFPRVLLVVVLVAAMLLKATLIAGYFMHLRFERLFLAWSVFLGLVVNGAILFGLLAPDGVRIFAMVAP